MVYFQIVENGLMTELMSKIIHLSINSFISAGRLSKLVIFSTLKPLISVTVEKSETKPFLHVLINCLHPLTNKTLHMLYMAGKLMTSTTRVIGNLLL